MRERDDRRAHDLADPVIREMNARISAVNDENARQAWVKEVLKSDHKNNLGHFWGKIRNPKTFFLSVW